ncbi:hypothetical protein [Chlamydia gallinacea]|uniref:Uncharacterized protein n=2 Tax=Chlamydia gallinacea TaxID=1457153 RepID=A0A173DYP0_9CHLA|nr:hypothetical protein [Chlamydia gallinacea]EYE60647.1 hypothetical protein M127_5487 [Bacteroides fragilis str. S6L5]ANG66042.1 hypothetical protein M787_001730 [Chlamydia gallinacea 08-1274/3]AQT77733.1 hypothetical protein B1F83_03895 [Chlamydia gallinacea]MBX6680047.1 hypothetical protein [Chlamydia gallinacea]MBX6687279.1 hypothetical protein [Chlamydia gallinacea]
MKSTIALFGEAEKGSYDVAYLCRSTADLYDHLGSDPTTTKSGISLAIQALMYNYNVLYFRVKEEGYCVDSYFFGLHFLNTQTTLKNIIAMGLPGVGDQHLIEASKSLCEKYKSLLLLFEQDLYDLLTFNKLF